MKVEYINDEMVVHLPKNIKFDYLQKLLDYIEVKNIVSKSQAKQEDINALTEEIDQNWWK
jgi:hypothetical protein